MDFTELARRVRLLNQLLIARPDIFANVECKRRDDGKEEMKFISDPAGIDIIVEALELLPELTQLMHDVIEAMPDDCDCEICTGGDVADSKQEPEGNN